MSEADGLIGEREAKLYADWLHAGNSTGSLSPHAIEALTDTINRAVVTALQQAISDRNEARIQAGVQNFGLKMANEDCDKLEAQVAIDEAKYLDLLERFQTAEAQLQRLTASLEDEREACARIADEHVFDAHELAQATQYGVGVHETAQLIAHAIRARKEKP
jgi:hypothetical protein